MAKKKKKDRMNTLVLFIFVTLLAILVSFFAFTYIFNKKTDPCFDYYGFKACAVALEGTNIIFYSIPVTFRVSGMSNENNVVIRTDPRKIEELNMSVNVPSVMFKTRPAVLYITMNPDSNSQVVAAAYEIVKFVGNLDFPSSMAFTERSEGISNETNVITCEQATNSQRVVWMKIMKVDNINLSSVSVSPDNPYCIIIESSSYNGLIESADAFVLEWLLRINEKK